MKVVLLTLILVGAVCLQQTSVAQTTLGTDDHHHHDISLNELNEEAKKGVRAASHKVMEDWKRRAKHSRRNPALHSRQKPKAGEVYQLDQRDFARAVFSTDKIVFVRFHHDSSYEGLGPHGHERNIPSTETWERLAEKYSSQFDSLLFAEIDGVSQDLLVSRYLPKKVAFPPAPIEEEEDGNTAVAASKHDDTWPFCILFRGVGGRSVRLQETEDTRGRFLFDKKNDDGLSIQEQMSQLSRFIDTWITKDKQLREDGAEL